jgi:hypothetical protein
LLYKLIRNHLKAIPAPTCGWGNQPLPGHLNETDDIERIRLLRNNLLFYETIENKRINNYDRQYKDKQ